MKTRSRRQGARLRTRHWARFPALVGACLLLVALPMAASDSLTPGFIGYDWQVITISYHGTATNIPASLQAFLWFSPDGQFGADAAANFQSGGFFHTTRDGFTVSDMGAGGPVAGYAGHDPTVMLAINAIGSFYFDDGVHATVKLTGDRLVVGVGSYTLTCQLHGPQADIPIWPALAGCFLKPLDRHNDPSSDRRVTASRKRPREFPGLRSADSRP
jgi:hypothetical protein